MEKAETLSFPTVKESGGHGQSLNGEILVGAKGLVVITLKSADFLSAPLALTGHT